MCKSTLNNYRLVSFPRSKVKRLLLPGASAVVYSVDGLPAVASNFGNVDFRAEVSRLPLTSRYTHTHTHTHMHTLTTVILYYSSRL